MEDKQIIFLDTEFTGLNQNARLISLALYVSDDNYFYAEFNDFDRTQITDWLRDNVITKLKYEQTNDAYENKGRAIEIKSNTKKISEEITKWISVFDQCKIWCDVGAYDWVLFCQLFGGSQNLPENISYIPGDLATLAILKKLDPDFSRFEFAGSSTTEKTSQHNALTDAKILSKCFKKMSMDIQESNQFKRLQQFRVDFAYSKNLYFNAAGRLETQYKCAEKTSQILNLVAAGLAIFTLTALQLYLNEVLQKSSIYVISGISFISVLISIYLFFHKNDKIYLAYYQRANDYLYIYKQVKNLEAKILDNQVSIDKLNEMLDKVNEDQKNLNAVQLPTTQSDYESAKKQIAEGNSEYTDQEIKNT